MAFTLDFTERVVWVTGAARGMGAHHAERFADAGARVACLDVDQNGALATAKRIRDGGGEAIAAAGDVSDWQSLQQAAESARSQLGPASVVVANAGIMMEPATVEKTDLDVWRHVLEVDLTGVFLTAKAAIPQLREAGGGSLVLIASISGLCGYPEFGAYNAAKHGVIGLMRTLANELGREGIRVNAVCPGWVDTPMLDYEAANLGLTRVEAAHRWAGQHLLERLVDPEEVSDAVLWLASDAAQMVTGVSLPVDGGLFERRPEPLKPTSA